MSRIHIPGAAVAARWNTHRRYDIAGRRMAAAFFPDRTVLFVDVDRGIEGWFRLDADLASLVYDDQDLRAEVMRCYGRGDYREPNHPHYDTLPALQASAKEL